MRLLKEASAEDPDTRVDAMKALGLAQWALRMVPEESKEAAEDFEAGYAEATDGEDASEGPLSEDKLAKALLPGTVGVGTRSALP